MVWYVANRNKQRLQLEVDPTLPAEVRMDVGGWIDLDHALTNVS